MVDTTSRLELLPAQRGLFIPKEVERTVVLTHRISRVPEGDRFGLFHESRTDRLQQKGSTAMQSVFIKFLSQEDRARGFYELATRARVASFPGEVYQVPIEALKLLNDQKISYRRATDAEVKAAHDQVRNPTPAIL